MALKLKVKMTEEQKKLFRETAADLNDSANEVDAQKARKHWAAQFGDWLMQTIVPAGAVRGIFETREAYNKPDGKFLVEVNDVYGWEAPTFGTFQRNYIEGDEAYVKFTQFFTNCYYPLDYAMNVDYDVANFALQKMNDALVRAEEEYGWSLIRYAANNGGSKQKIEISNGQKGAGTWSKELINSALLYFEKEGKTLDAIYGPPTVNGDVRMWTDTSIDQTTRRVVFQNGGMSSIWKIELVSIPLIVFYLTVDDKKSRKKQYLDRLFNPNDKLVDGSAAWTTTQKSKYASGKLEVAYGISRRNFGIYALRTKIRTVEDPTAITQWMQGILARFSAGFLVVDGENIVRLIVDRDSVPA